SAAKDIRNRSLDRRNAADDRGDIRLSANFDTKVVDIADATGERGWHFFQNSEAKVFENRNRVGQGDKSAYSIDFQTELTRGIGIRPRDPNVTVVVVLEIAKAKNVCRTFIGRGARAITVRECVDVGEREAGRSGRACRLDELGLDRRGPAPHHLDDGNV